MATQNLGRVKIVWKGDYSSNTAYVVDDAVFYEGSSYICKQNATAKIPTNTNYWDKMASKGNSGAVPAIGMSATVDGTSSATPSVTVTEGGTALQPTFELAFSGLKGAKGDKGDKGDTGASGDLAWDDVNKSVQKNLLKNNMVNHAKNNVTFTVANNKEISLSGTSTGDITVGNDNGTIGSVADLPYGTYKLSGCPENGSGSTYRLSIQNKAGTAWVTDTGSGAEFTVDSNSTWDLVYIRANSGVNLTGKVFKPMICLASIADSTYEPYIPNNTELFPRSEQAVLGAKNLLPNNAQSQTVSNVTYTVNSDGSVSCADTSNAVSWLPIWRGKLKRGTYIISGCPAGGGASGSTYRIGFWNETPSAGSLIDVRETGDGKIVTIDDDTQDYAVYVGCGSGTNMNGVTFKPMLRLATDTDSTYAPYAMTNKELTDAVQPVLVNALANNSDLDNYTKEGVYFGDANSTYTHSPVTGIAFRLEVKPFNLDKTRCIQVIYTNATQPSIYLRTNFGGTLQSWYKIDGTVVS